MRDWKDRLGIFASVACAIHCAATPILVAALPTLKFTEWMVDPRFHQVVAVLCSALVAIAIWPAFVRFRDYSILSLSMAGLGLILSAAFLLPPSCCSVAPSVAADMCCAGDTSPAIAFAAAGQDHDGHDHDGHDHARHDHAEHGPELALAGVGIFQPWMTPIGGVLLVIAHGLNLRRRLGCSSACCPGSNSEADLLAMPDGSVGASSCSLARAS
jgi:hypothetical protein